MSTNVNPVAVMKACPFDRPSIDEGAVRTFKVLDSCMAIVFEQ
jgi:hypothetical protein